MKIDIGAENTFTKDDLMFMVKAVISYSNDAQAVKCLRLLKAALSKLKGK